jgi:gas vesicle protein
MSTGKVVLGIMAGLAAGALLGVLFAPEKGSETRMKISKKSEDLADEIKEKFDELLDSITDKFEKVKDEVSDFADRNKGKTGEVYMDDKSAHN